MRWKTAAFALAALISIGALASAEPLVTKKDGKPAPGVIKSWSGSGKKIELTLQDDADPQAVASAIEAAVDRTRVKVRAGRLLVIGMKQADLLEALTEVELGGDDLDVLAAAASSEEDFDTGSSLRAKKTAKLTQLLNDRKTTAIGTVVAVKSGAFPNALVSVRILRGPTGVLGKAIRKGRTIKFRPALAKKKGRLDLTDEATIANLGAWYLKKGDRVQVKVGKSTQGTYEALLIVR